mmetsp:Transcript_11771/g.26412  ORF Transcript_11771/g.26412 Transcript_11771/m.26412 type:complete len:250 (-) Transcript_11771:22-771(-)
MVMCGTPPCVRTIAVTSVPSAAVIDDTVATFNEQVVPQLTSQMARTSHRTFCPTSDAGRSPMPPTAPGCNTVACNPSTRSLGGKNTAAKRDVPPLPPPLPTVAEWQICTYSAAACAPGAHNASKRATTAAENRSAATFASQRGHADCELAGQVRAQRAAASNAPSYGVRLLSQPALRARMSSAQLRSTTRCTLGSTSKLDAPSAIGSKYANEIGLWPSRTKAGATVVTSCLRNIPSRERRSATGCDAVG